MKKVLITGAVGFIGYHLSKTILSLEGFNVIGIDNMDNYYDVKLKKDRLKILKENNNFKFFKVDIINKNKISNLFKKYKFTYVIHLAAQAGVRYSIENPEKYLQTNINGFFNIINMCKEKKIKHFLYASTSSVYGNNSNFPLNEDQPITKPLSFYAATKISNEVIAHSFSNIYKLRSTGLRFFTVYGPFGRPDMALFKFTNSIVNGEPISLFNHGNHIRDFTYVDDVVESIIRLINKPPTSKIPHEVYNIGSSNPKELREYVSEIEVSTGKKSKIKKMGLQAGDVFKTYADTKKIYKKIRYKPKYDIKYGISKFVYWFKNYYK
tara:strand:+ start:602 stop:1570 length:969 start_codon:yes stop_codon:yes gene_type:complete